MGVWLIGWPLQSTVERQLDMFTLLLLLATLSFSSAKRIEQLLVRSSERRQFDETCVDGYFLCPNGVWCCRAHCILPVLHASLPELIWKRMALNALGPHA